MNDYISVSEAKSKGIIPKAYHSLVQDTCACGAEIITNINLTKQKCANPRCPLKLSGRAIKLLNNFGIKGVAKSYCDKFFSQNNYTSHLAILCAPKEDYYKTGRIADTEHLLESLKQAKREFYTFNDLVSRLALPNLNIRAMDIFEGYNSYQMFLETLKYNNLTIREYLLMNSGISDILADSIERTCSVFADELSCLPQIFKIRNNGILKLSICMTGDMQYKMFTKKKFLSYVNLIGNGYVEVLSTEAKKSADYIVSALANQYELDENDEVCVDEDDEPIIVSYTNKHNCGVLRNKTDGYKVLITPQELVNIVSMEASRIFNEERVGRDIVE